ncbi:hypothetical protein EI983_03100 [Roseovarius faecimaris]|uniref:UPF0102 protein EI983_03100 n=1 Tax=Roseovarius faecimaris TaxID=2494550 RepID=A0A6I6IXF1_9RHOB|nr:YraN family protein [Roseovarius faecimaris]QGX97318.1 hypothetical protein EI983_03100 [Roseovarius faecimaris]
MQHFNPHSAFACPVEPRRLRGKSNYLSGLAAESAVRRRYETTGAVLAAERWRGQGGEIDLIFLEGDVIVFVEVKKGPSFEWALTRLSEAQMMRIHRSAAEFLGTTPRGQLSEVRFDLALVDQSGAVQVMENAFGHF